LLGNDREISNFTTAVAGEGLHKKHVSTATREYSNNGTDVIYEVRAEKL
jgi:hypothetical protein